MKTRKQFEKENAQLRAALEVFTHVARLRMKLEDALDHLEMALEASGGLLDEEEQQEERDFIKDGRELLEKTK